MSGTTKLQDACRTCQETRRRQAVGLSTVHCAEGELEAQNLESSEGASNANGFPRARGSDYPDALDWMAPGVLKEYEAIGNRTNSAQVHPYLYTTSMARLAEEKGARIIIGNATQINYSSDGKAVESIRYVQDGKSVQEEATDIVVAAGPWDAISSFRSFVVDAPGS